VPLDAHGNPVEVEEVIRPSTFNEQGEHVELGENVRFVSDRDHGHVNYQVGSVRVCNAESLLIIFARSAA